MELDPARPGTQVGQVGVETVPQHSLARAEVEVTLDIRATARDCAPEAVLRSLSKSATTLGFDERKSVVDKRTRSDQDPSKTQ